MQLYYFKKNNFGDALNPWFFDQVLPGFFDEDANALFSGIGTLLNHHMPSAAKTIVFGTGGGYGRLPEIDKSWEFICVRGPLTAQALGLDAGLACADPAILMPRLYRAERVSSVSPAPPVSFVPHFRSAVFGQWEEACASAGVGYISPTAEPLDVCKQIAGARYILAESMHGAIIADAYRVPWAIVQMNSFLHPKWRDWMLSLDLDVDQCPKLELQQMWRPRGPAPPPTRIRSALKRRLAKVSAGRGPKLHPVDYPNASKQLFDSQVERLRGAAQLDFVLSKSQTLADRQDRLETLLHALRERRAKAVG